MSAPTPPAAGIRPSVLRPVRVRPPGRQARLNEEAFVARRAWPQGFGPAFPLSSGTRSSVQIVDLALLVLGHTTGDALADQRTDDTLGFDDLIGANDPAPEFLVCAQRADLLFALAQQGKAPQVAAVGFVCCALEPLDLAVALEPSPILNARG